MKIDLTAEQCKILAQFVFDNWTDICHYANTIDDAWNLLCAYKILTIAENKDREKLSKTEERIRELEAQLGIRRPKEEKHD